LPIWHCTKPRPISAISSNRGYPREASLALVGNRYDLDRAAGNSCTGGCSPGRWPRPGGSQAAAAGDLAGLPLALDGHNVLITLESALKGRALVAADDGFMRDVAQLSRAYRDSPATRQALGSWRPIPAATTPAP
jgi:hypothetical protein